jgi:hypothetical protein
VRETGSTMEVADQDGGCDEACGGWVLKCHPITASQ